MKRKIKVLILFICFSFLLMSFFVTTFNSKKDVLATEYQETSVNVSWDKDCTKYYNGNSDFSLLTYSGMSNWYKENSTENNYFRSEDNSNGISVRTNSVNTGTAYSMGIFIPFEVSIPYLSPYGYYDDVSVNFEMNYIKPDSPIQSMIENYPSYNIVLFKYDSNDTYYSNLSFSNKNNETEMYVWNIDVLNNGEEYTNSNGLVTKVLIPSVKDLSFSFSDKMDNISNTGDKRKEVINNSVLNNYGLYIYSPNAIGNALSFDLNISLKYDTSGSYEAYNKDTSKYYQTLEDAINASDNTHNNISIVRSLTNYDNLIIDKDVNLSFDDNESGSITFSENKKLTISEGTNVSIKGGKIIGNSTEVVACYGNLSILFNTINNTNIATNACAIHNYESGHIDFSGQVDGSIGILNEGTGCIYHNDEIYNYKTSYTGSNTALYIEKGYISLIHDVSFTTVSINVNNDAYLSAYALGYGEELHDKYYRGDLAPIVTVTCYGTNLTKDKKIVRDIENSGYVFNNANRFELVSASFDDSVLEEKLYEDGYGLYYKTLEGKTYELTPNGDYSDMVNISNNNLQATCDFNMTIEPKYGYTYPISIDGVWSNTDEYHLTINSIEDKVSINPYNIYGDLTYSINATTIEVPITYHIDELTTHTNPSKFNINDDDFELLDAKKEGYEFAGWFIDSNFNNRITKIITDYEVDDDGKVIGLDLYPRFVKESVNDFLNIQTKGSLKFEYNTPIKKEIEQYFGNNAVFASENSEVEFISYASENSQNYGPRMHYFSISDNYGGVDWNDNSAFIISCNDNWTIKKVTIGYRDDNAHLISGYELRAVYGEYSEFDYTNLGTSLDTQITCTSINGYVDIIELEESNITRLCMINRTNKLWIDEITIELEEQYEIKNTSIRFGVDGVNDFNSTLYESILSDYKDSEIKFGVAINKGASFNPEKALKVDTTIDVDNIGDKTFALLLANVTEFDRLLSASAYVCIDGVYYYAKPTTYSINTIANKYLDLFEDDINMAKYIDVLKYLKNAKYNDVQGD